MKILILTALIITTIALTAISQTAGEYIHNPTGAIAEEFGEGNVAGIRYAENGTVKTINGKLDKGITAVEPLDKCYEFFELHKDLFGLVNPREELKLITALEDPDIYKFRQCYHEIEIARSRIDVSFNRDGSISGVSGKFFPEVRGLSTSPSISNEIAKQKAFGAYENTKSHAKPNLHSIELIFVKDKENDRLALIWEVSINHYRFWLDALSGEEKGFFDVAKR
ncbi:MAG: hypothetical protein GY839_08085 [candidate division Zixibacteria bacterium]|nr:hypothetical protein [candidate division Zixibacteria bacterium]